MADPNVPKIARFTFVWSQLIGVGVSKTMSNRVHLIKGSGSTDWFDSDFTGVFTAALGWWNATGKPLTTNAIVLVRMDCTPYRGATSPTFTSAVGTAGTIGAGTLLPPQVTYRTKFTTGFGGRRYRGGWQWWPPIEGSEQADSAHILGTKATALDSGAAALQTAFTSGTPNATIVLFHRATSDWTPVTGFTHVTTRLRTLHHRMLATG